MRTKTKPLPFNLLDVADADTVDYNGDTNIQDVNLIKIAILTAKKISEQLTPTLLITMKTQIYKTLT